MNDLFINIINNNNLLAPLIALFAGIITSFTPCSLSTIPLIIGFVGGAREDTRKSFRLSLLFALGMSLTFTALGVIAATIGKALQYTGKWWYIFLGIIMIIMALQMCDIFTFIKPTYLTSKNNKKGYFGAFFTGVLGGFFSSPCATPILVVLLAIVSGGNSILWGTFLLLMYAIGNSILVIIAGTFTGFTKKIMQNKSYGKWSEILKYIVSILILIFALYMFYLGF